MNEEDKQVLTFLLSVVGASILFYLAMVWGRGALETHSSYMKWVGYGALALGSSLVVIWVVILVVHFWQRPREVIDAQVHAAWEFLNYDSPNTFEIIVTGQVQTQNYRWIPEQVDPGRNIEEWEKCLLCGAFLDKAIPPKYVDGHKITFRQCCCACYNLLQTEERQRLQAETEIRRQAAVDALWEDLVGDVAKTSTLLLVYDFMMFSLLFVQPVLVAFAQIVTKEMKIIKQSLKATETRK